MFSFVARNVKIVYTLYIKMEKVKKQQEDHYEKKDTGYNFR